MASTTACNEYTIGFPMATGDVSYVYVVKDGIAKVFIDSDAYSDELQVCKALQSPATEEAKAFRDEYFPQFKGESHVIKGEKRNKALVYEKVGDDITVGWIEYDSESVRDFKNLAKFLLNYLYSMYKFNICHGEIDGGNIIVELNQRGNGAIHKLCNLRTLCSTVPENEYFPGLPYYEMDEMEEMRAKDMMSCMSILTCKKNRYVYKKLPLYIKWTITALINAMKIQKQSTKDKEFAKIMNQWFNINKDYKDDTEEANIEDEDDEDDYEYDEEDEE